MTRRVSRDFNPPGSTARPPEAHFRDRQQDGNDTLDGGIGDDFLLGGRGADALIGGAGIDTASYWNSSAAVRVDLRTGQGTGANAQGDTFDGIENVIGSRFDDVLVGDAAYFDTFTRTLYAVDVQMEDGRPRLVSAEAIVEVHQDLHLGGRPIETRDIFLM
jgi:hypothetical protein